MEEIIILNGQKWYDTDGNVIHAHGGWILKVEDWFYWYGEDRTSNNYVACYRTKDFKSFEFRNHILTTESKYEKAYVEDCDLMLKHSISDFNGQIQVGVHRSDGEYIYANIERPKVVYCEKTKKYVMWMHYENGYNYHAAACAVASCDTPDGDFIYHGSFRPFGNMSRDCTVFADGEDMYFTSSSRDNKDLYIYRMTENYLSVDKVVNVLFQNQSREAPAFFKKDGKIFVLSSGCTGWLPNQGKFSFSSSGLEGRWSLLGDFGNETTYMSQPAFVFSVDNNGEKEYYYFADRWGRYDSDYFKSTYVVLKIEFDKYGNPYIAYTDEAQLPQI